jgi:hypothetical protein
LKVSGELGLAHDLRDRALDPNGLGAKGQAARRRLAGIDFSPDKKLAVPEGGMKFQDIERRRAHVCRQGNKPVRTDSNRPPCFTAAIDSREGA